jgi:thymidylate synthase
MHSYLELLKTLRQQPLRPNRTGVATSGIFGARLEFDLSAGFPLMTTKRVSAKMVLAELLWFLSGQTHLEPLHAHGCHIWDEWAKDGQLGRIYGAQWRSWQNPHGQKIDQIQKLITGLRTEPYSRRHLVLAWNPGELDEMALPPCHAMFQMYVHEGTLSCQMYQRSCDVFLGLPYNIASYAFLVHMIAQQTDLSPGRLLWVGGDVHLYENHFAQADEQISREPRTLPVLALNKKSDIFSYSIEDFVLQGYDPHPAIKGEIAV